MNLAMVQFYVVENIFTIRTNRKIVRVVNCGFGNGGNNDFGRRATRGIAHAKLTAPVQSEMTKEKEAVDSIRLGSVCTSLVTFERCGNAVFNNGRDDSEINFPPDKPSAGIPQ